MREITTADNIQLSNQLEVLSSLKSNPLNVFKLKDEFSKVIDANLKEFMNSINDEKKNDGFSENTYKHLYGIATSQYFDKLAQVIYRNRYFNDYLYYNILLRIKSKEESKDFLSKLKELVKRIQEIPPENPALGNKNWYAEMEAINALGNGEDVGPNKLSQIKLHQIVHFLYQKCLLADSKYKNQLNQILYEVDKLLDVSKTDIIKNLKVNKNDFIYVHKKLNDILLGGTKEQTIRKIESIEKGKFKKEVDRLILDFGERNKSGARRFYIEVYSLVIDYHLNTDVTDKVFDYISAKIVEKNHKPEIAILDFDKNFLNDDKTKSYDDWSTNASYFDLSKDQIEDSNNIIRYKDSIVALLRHPLNHLFYTVLLYKIKKHIKISYKEFIYMEYLSNYVFASSYDEYMIMSTFNRDLKFVLYNRASPLFHVKLRTSWIILLTLLFGSLHFIFQFPLALIALGLLYLWYYYRSEFNLEVDKSGMKYYLGGLIVIIFVAFGGLNTEEMTQRLHTAYQKFQSSNIDGAIVNGAEYVTKSVANILEAYKQK